MAEYSYVWVTLLLGIMIGAWYGSIFTYMYIQLKHQSKKDKRRGEKNAKMLH